MFQNVKTILEIRFSPADFDMWGTNPGRAASYI